MTPSCRPDDGRPGARPCLWAATGLTTPSAPAAWRRDLAGDLFPDDESAEHLYQPARYWLWTDHFLHIGHRADFGPYADLQDD
jgi:hypothetical protein